MPEEVQEQKLIKKLKSGITNIYDSVKQIYDLKLIKKNQISYSLLNRQIEEKKIQQTILNLTKFLYLLRSFLTKEEIVLRLGGTDIENRELTKVDISQDKWLESICVNIAAESIQLSNMIEEKIINEEKKNQNNSLYNLWQDVKQWGSFAQIYDQVPDNEKDGHVYYQKNEKDSEVWVKFTTKKDNSRQVTAYYCMELYYNMGWLYEWFMDCIEYTEMPIDKIHKTLKSMKHPLAFFFYFNRPDSMPSLFGGDVKNFQIKYENEQLITFHQLLLKIQLLKDLIDRYDEEQVQSYPDLIEDMKKMFIAENKHQLNESTITQSQELLDQIITKKQYEFIWKC